MTSFYVFSTTKNAQKQYFFWKKNTPINPGQSKKFLSFKRSSKLYFSKKDMFCLMWRFVDETFQSMAVPNPSCGIII